MLQAVKPLNTNPEPAHARAKHRPDGRPITMPDELPEWYALNVSGDCMSPEIRHGDFVACTSATPYARGDLVCIWRRPETLRPGEPQCSLKRIIFAPPPGLLELPYDEHPDNGVRWLIVCEQLNPRKQVTYRCADLLAIHRCLGTIAREKAIPLASRKTATKRS